MRCRRPPGRGEQEGRKDKSISIPKRRSPSPASVDLLSLSLFVDLSRASFAPSLAPPRERAKQKEKRRKRKKRENGPRRLDLRAPRLPPSARAPGQAALRRGRRAAGRGRERRAGLRARHHLRGHPRAVLRPQGALRHGRGRPEDLLPLPGRLCRPGLLLGRDFFAAPRAQGALPGPGGPGQGEPRVEADHAGLRLLRRVRAQVRQRQRVALLRRLLRLPLAGRLGRRRPHLCRARRAQPGGAHARLPPRDRQEAGGAARGGDVRPAVVGPGAGRRGVGAVASRGK